MSGNNINALANEKPLKPWIRGFKGTIIQTINSMRTNENIENFETYGNIELHPTKKNALVLCICILLCMCVYMYIYIIMYVYYCDILFALPMLLSNIIYHIIYICETIRTVIMIFLSKILCIRTFFKSNIYLFLKLSLWLLYG